MNRDRYCQETERLFQLWKQKPPMDGINHANQVFIRDGIVCPDMWFQQEVRPLFLLKEAYGGGTDWCLIHDHLLQDKPIKGPTWKRISQWSYGLMGTTAEHIPAYTSTSEMCRLGNSYLKQIAVVNVKKSGGEKTSNMETINRYAKVDRWELRQELELIDPTVIVCGYTISSLNIIMEKEIKDYNNSNDNLSYTMELNGHHVSVLDYYHPSNRYPDIMNYYGLMCIYQKALQKIE